ncbi:hypothetical protein NVP1031O_068 [Vibrio phage 1.031.O._10N.261.46.F8]|nr:hypothetical protein NVP1031O_068 [Vibrio phage 1.031.O._10N.261.46.F8]
MQLDEVSNRLLAAKNGNDFEARLEGERLSNEFIQNILDGKHPCDRNGGAGSVDLYWVTTPKIKKSVAMYRVARYWDFQEERPTACDMDGYMIGDMILWENWKRDNIEGKTFDVYTYYARLRFNHDFLSWKNLDKGIQDGYLNIARHDVTSAIRGEHPYQNAQEAAAAM